MVGPFETLLHVTPEMIAVYVKADHSIVMTDDPHTIDGDRDLHC
jgi:hypothetical protein